MQAAEVIRILPSYSINGTQRRLSPFKYPEHAKHLFDGLSKAGLPVYIKEQQDNDGGHLLARRQP